MIHYQGNLSICQKQAIRERNQNFYQSQSSVNLHLRILCVVTKKSPTQFGKFLAHLLFRKMLSIYSLFRIKNKKQKTYCS